VVGKNKSPEVPDRLPTILDDENQETAFLILSAIELGPHRYIGNNKILRPIVQMVLFRKVDSLRDKIAKERTASLLPFDDEKPYKASELILNASEEKLLSRVLKAEYAYREDNFATHITRANGPTAEEWQADNVKLDRLRAALPIVSEAPRV
jgi:hypothetical protein